VTVDIQQEVGEPLPATRQGKIQYSKLLSTRGLGITTAHQTYVFCRDSYVCCLIPV